jgi:hypothetical protein
MRNLLADLREIDSVDSLDDERQAAQSCFPLFVRMLVVKAATEHVLFSCARPYNLRLVHSCDVFSRKQMTIELTGKREHVCWRGSL